MAMQVPVPQVAQYRPRSQEGGAALRQRVTDPTPDEELVDLLAETFAEDLDDLVEMLIPDGRPLFTVPLTRAEVQLLMLKAQPPQWETWRAQVDTIADPEERREAAARLFDGWARQQLAQLQQEGRTP